MCSATVRMAAVAAAWDDRMDAMRESCRATVEALHRDGMLAGGWTLDEAADFLWTMPSIRNWESLTIECGWPQERYAEGMKKLTKRAIVREPEEK